VAKKISKPMVHSAQAVHLSWAEIKIVSKWIEACFHLPTDEILTYGYVKPRDLWFPTEEGPSVDPLGSPGGSGGYTYQVRLRAPLD
jgi:hypothetical protein